MSDGPQPDEEELSRLFDSVVGTVSLRVSDLGRQRDFYAAALGLEARDDGATRAEIVGGGGNALLSFDAAAAARTQPPAGSHTGLFHNAFRYPDRASLGAAVRRTAELAPVVEGASDHGVSDAVYFRDPEGNGIELYWDRPYEEWPTTPTGGVGMYTRPLDLRALIADADEDASNGGCDIGHIHLQTADVEPTMTFWRDVIGLDERQRFGSQAIFLAEGLYHHHIGANTWQSAGAGPAPPDTPGLAGFELCLRSAARVDAAAARLEEAGVNVVSDRGHVAFADLDGNRVRLLAR